MRGVVAAGHPLTAEAGAQVLRAGGNAVDAALAAMVTSFVTEPQLTGLGAGGYYGGACGCASTNGQGGWMPSALLEYDGLDWGEVVPGTATPSGFDIRTYVYRIPASPQGCTSPGPIDFVR